MWSVVSACASVNAVFLCFCGYLAALARACTRYAIRASHFFCAAFRYALLAGYCFASLCLRVVLLPRELAPEREPSRERMSTWKGSDT